MDRERAVSPVLGVILLVAVTVILSAVVGTFALDIGNNVQETPRAGVSIDQSGSTVTVQAVSLEADSVTVTAPEKADVEYSNGDALTEVGHSVTIYGVSAGETVTALAYATGEEAVIQSHTVDGESLSFYGSFEDGTLDNWEVVSGGQATVTDTALYGDHSLLVQSNADSSHTYLRTADPIANAKTFRATFQVEDSSGDFSLHFDGSGTDTYYRVDYLPADTDNPRYQIKRVESGTTTTLAQKSPELSYNQETTMEVTRDNGDIRVVVSNGETEDVLAASDSTPLTEGGQVWVHGYNQVRIDKVTAIAED